MRHRLTLLMGCILGSLLVISCNIYSQLDSISSDEDHLEAGQACLHEGDYGCAIEHYGQVQNPAKRKRKLCMAYLAKSGFTLSSFLNTIEQTSDTMLGQLATSFLPWNETKARDAELGNISCVDYSNENATETDAVLLKLVGILVGCTMQMAKSDHYQTISTGEDCATVSNTNGQVTQSDIGPATGIPTSGTPGMCKSGIATCKSETYGLSSIDPDALDAANLPALADSIRAIPAALRTSSTPDAAYRAALRSRTAND